MRARAAGIRVRQLLQEGLRARALANAMGWTRQDVETTRRAMDLVRSWLDRNPCPSPAALGALLTDHWAALRSLIPANAAGKQRLARIQQTIQSLQP